MNAPLNPLNRVAPHNQFLTHMDGWDIYYTDVGWGTYIWAVGKDGNGRRWDMDPYGLFVDHSFLSEPVKQFCLAYHALIS